MVFVAIYSTDMPSESLVREWDKLSENNHVGLGSNIYPSFKKKLNTPTTKPFIYHIIVIVIRWLKMSEEIAILLLIGYILIIPVMYISLGFYFGIKGLIDIIKRYKW